MSVIKELLNRRKNKRLAKEKQAEHNREMTEANLSHRSRTNLAHDRKKKKNKYTNLYS